SRDARPRFAPAVRHIDRRQPGAVGSDGNHFGQARALGCRLLLDHGLSGGGAVVRPAGLFLSAKPMALGGDCDADAAWCDAGGGIGPKSAAAGAGVGRGTQSASNCGGDGVGEVKWLDRYSVLSPRITSSPKSLIFLRSVFRFKPSNCAARIWLPRVAARQIEISGRSTSCTMRS